jgi:lauroyl/myristoyl acyltransferase
VEAFACFKWCLERKNIRIIANGNWMKKRKQVQIGSTGFRELKKAIHHLRHKGHVVIALDGFNQSSKCRVNFQGNACNASMFPLRLSRLGQVPLIMAIPIFTNGTVHFY